MTWTARNEATQTTPTIPMPIHERTIDPAPRRRQPQLCEHPGGAEYGERKFGQDARSEREATDGVRGKGAALASPEIEGRVAAAQPADGMSAITCGP